MSLRKQESDALQVAAVVVTKAAGPDGIDAVTKSLTTTLGVLLIPQASLRFLPGDCRETFTVEVELPGPHHPFGKRCLYCSAVLADIRQVEDGLVEVDIRIRAMRFRPTSRT